MKKLFKMLNFYLSFFTKGNYFCEKIIRDNIICHPKLNRNVSYNFFHRLSDKFPVNKSNWLLKLDTIRNDR